MSIKRNTYLDFSIKLKEKHDCNYDINKFITLLIKSKGKLESPDLKTRFSKLILVSLVVNDKKHVIRL